MTHRLRLLLSRLHQRLWFRPALWSMLAVVVSAISATADAWWPAHRLPDLADGVVDDLLHIMASSMLAVSTFALSVLVSAFSSAATAGTPRAARLVVADPQAQRAVASFLASFIFAVIGIIALGTRVYGSAARFTLFLFALAMLVWIVYSFMGFMETLSKIGRVAHTIATVERATHSALQARRRAPLLGATPCAEPPPPDARAVRADRSGYVQVVDVDALQALAARLETRMHLVAGSGDFVSPASVLAWFHAPANAMDAEAERDADQAVRDAVALGPERAIEQDASFGLIVLAEIAQRALSPAVNDPGTAIAVLGSLTRLLIDALAPDRLAPSNEPLPDPVDRVLAPVPQPAGLVPLSYDPIARSGAAVLEVQQQLQRHLGHVAAACGGPVAQAAHAQGRRALERAAHAGLDAADLALLHQAHRQAFG